jgi:redox-sensitive bicupin YhaK (pirin superfamily)
MLKVRKSRERGLGDHGWLKSRHTFSFANYYDPAEMGFRALRVINEDRITGGSGFAPHAHRDMEIISYVVDGALEHKDSAGNATVIRPGEVQRMSAGRGVTHSEYNHSPDKAAHFFQIWIVPRQTGLPFGYGQKNFAEELSSQKLTLAISPDGEKGSIPINQDARLSIGRLAAGESVELGLNAERHGWLQVVKGALTVNGLALEAGDGLAASEESLLRAEATAEAEFLFFDLA